MICNKFIFKQIHVLPRDSPRGYPVNNGRNNIQWCQGGSNRNERTLIFDTPRTGIEREHDF